MIKEDAFFEVVKDELYPLNADIYHKEAGKYYVGYRNAEGRYAVYEKDELLNLSKDDNPAHGALLYRVDMY